MIGHAVRERVEAFLHTAPVPLDVQFYERIQRFAGMLAVWGSKMNLTADPGDPSEIGFHLIDSIMPLVLSYGDGSILHGTFDLGHEILDMGSGAGFPGLVLAAASSAQFTLVESRRKRASFLQVAVAEMQLPNVAVQPRRVSDLDLEGRAFGDSREFFSLALRALRPDGLAILYANPSQRFADEIERIPYRIPRGGQQIERILAVQKRT